MMRLRSLALLLMCALASACATTGHRTADTATSPDAPVIADDVAAADPSMPSVVGDVEPAMSKASVIADATQAQDAGTDATTGDAEADFAAIYGAPGNDNRAAMGGMPAPAVYDPWEKVNRRVHAFNMAVDRGLAKPLARGYVAVVPRPVRAGVDNFFNNLGQPVTLVNSLLQGNPRGAANALGRFLGTLLSGLLYQWGGLLYALLGSALMLLICWLVTLALPLARHDAARVEP